MRITPRYEKTIVKKPLIFKPREVQISKRSSKIYGMPSDLIIRRLVTRAEKAFDMLEIKFLILVKIYSGKIEDKLIFVILSPFSI